MKTVIEMALKAGNDDLFDAMQVAFLERFADLVRADERARMAEQPAQQEPVDSTQVSKVWWDGEKLMAKPIPFVEFYKPAQRTWVGLTDEEIEQSCVPLGAAMLSFTEVARAIEAKLKEKNT